MTVLSYNSYSQDTTTRVPNRILAKIYTDLTVCETSLTSCKSREVLYLRSLVIATDNYNMCNEAMYNDSLVIDVLTIDNNILREDKNILQKTNKNLVKSNNFLKLGFGSSLIAIIILLIL